MLEAAAATTGAVARAAARRGKAHSPRRDAASLDAYAASTRHPPTDARASSRALKDACRVDSPPLLLLLLLPLLVQLPLLPLLPAPRASATACSSRFSSHRLCCACVVVVAACDMVVAVRLMRVDLCANEGTGAGGSSNECVPVVVAVVVGPAPPARRPPASAAATTIELENDRHWRPRSGLAARSSLHVLPSTPRVGEAARRRMAFVFLFCSAAVCRSSFVFRVLTGRAASGFRFGAVFYDLRSGSIEGDKKE